MVLATTRNGLVVKYLCYSLHLRMIHHIGNSQQTLLYFYDPIDMELGQIIEDSVTLSQSKENPRFFNIHFKYISSLKYPLQLCCLATSEASLIFAVLAVQEVVLL